MSASSSIARTRAAGSEVLDISGNVRAIRNEGRGGRVPYARGLALEVGPKSRKRLICRVGTQVATYFSSLLDSESLLSTLCLADFDSHAMKTLEMLRGGSSFADGTRLSTTSVGYAERRGAEPLAAVQWSLRDAGSRLRATPPLSRSSLTT